MALTPNIARARSTQVSILPQFIHEDNPLLVEFLRNYYEWESRMGADAAFESIKLNNDVDTVLDEMLVGFKRSFAKNFPEVLATDFRHFSKFLKEFYQTKGTEDAFKIFFRAAYNQPAAVEYPRVKLFKPSNSAWDRTGSIKSVHVSGESPFSQIGHEIVGKTSGASAIVYDVRKVNYAGVDHYELLVESIRGDFESLEFIDCSVDGGVIRSTLIPSYGISIDSSTQVWYDGDVLEFPVNKVFAKVDKIHYGKVVGFTISGAGSGYEPGDEVRLESFGQGAGVLGRVSSVGASGEIQSIDVIRSGFGFNTDWVVATFITTSGTGAVVYPVFDSNFRKIKHATVLSAGPYQAPYTPRQEVIAGCTVNMTPVPVEYSPKTTILSGAPSSEVSKVHDSSYYQEHSYEIRSNANFIQHQSAIGSLLHVAGLKMFGRATVEVEITGHDGAELTPLGV